MGELGYILKKQVIFLARISNKNGLALSFSKTANDAKITKKPTLLIMKAASTSHERRLKCIFCSLQAPPRDQAIFKLQCCYCDLVIECACEQSFLHDLYFNFSLLYCKVSNQVEACINCRRYLIQLMRGRCGLICIFRKDLINKRKTKQPLKPSLRCSRTCHKIPGRVLLNRPFRLCKAGYYYASVDL